MFDYFDDIEFRVVTHRFQIYGYERFSVAESNSLEFIRSGDLRLEHPDGSFLDLKAPAFFWLPEGSVFRYIPMSPRASERGIEHIYADICGPRSDRMMRYLDSLFPERVFNPEEPEKFSDTFFELLHLYRDDKEKNHPGMVLLAEKLIVLAGSSTMPLKIHDPYGLDSIAAKMRTDPFNEFDCRKLAQQAGLSQDHFRKLFRERHALPPKSYLNHQRMLRAAELLRTTEMRIKEIVLSCRFASTMDFSRNFKKYSGLSPRAYREKFRNTQQM